MFVLIGFTCNAEPRLDVPLHSVWVRLLLLLLLLLFDLGGLLPRGLPLLALRPKLDLHRGGPGMRTDCYCWPFQEVA